MANPSAARLSHSQRAKRRKAMAEFVRRGHEVAAVAQSLGVSVRTVIVACEEHGVAVPVPATSKSRGRPTQRQLGRVTDHEWEVMRAAARQSGKSFSAWAREILLAAAGRC